MASFKLSAVLQGHKSDVRAVLLPASSIALTASRDGSTKCWKRTNESPPVYDPDELTHGSQFKTCLAYIPPSKQYEQGLVISAGQDTLIEARQPSTTAEQNADAMMVGHSNQVCALDVSPKGDWLVSGGWDNTAKIWRTGRWEAETDLPNHTATVWAVLAYDQDTVVTGCADRAIRVFTITGKMLIAFDGHDVVRALTKVEGHQTGAQIAAATNDGVIRLWTLDGKLKGELHGHESFIYSLAVLPSGEIVSSGEDRSMRIWRGTECVQVITLPAISVWSVATSVKGDIIVGSSDKIARIFTRDTSRQAEPATIQEFDQAVQSSALPKQQVGDIKTSDLPGPEFLTRKSGTKEGQTAIVKDESGQPIVYQWSMSNQTWIKIGQVVDSAASGDKKMHNGKEYDYVFDVDIEDGKPPLKLPYNVTQNPYDAATKFLQDNELPISYLEETANFIIKNAQAATLGQQSAPIGADPWGTENRYRLGEIPQSTYQPPPPPEGPSSTLPQKTFLQIVQGKPGTAATQIAKVNAGLDPSVQLSQDNLRTLHEIATKLDTYDFTNRASLPQELVESSVSLLFQVLKTWEPLKNQLAALDLLRFVAAASLDFPVSSDEAVGALIQSPIFTAENIRANNKLAMVGYRVLSNLLYGSESGRTVVQIYADDVIKHLRVGSQAMTESIDVNFAAALTTLCLNLSVQITSDKTDQSVQQGIQLVEILSNVLNTMPGVDHAGTNPLAQTTEPAYRALVALGTVLVTYKSNADTKKAAASLYNISAVLQHLKSKRYTEEPRFKRVIGHIQKVM